MMKYNNIKTETNDRIMILTIDRPERLNALSREVLVELDDILERTAVSDDTDVIIITGSGAAFVAGADIAHMKEMDPVQAQEFSLMGSAILRKIETIGKAVICAVNGYALGGGCELVLACDIRIASQSAKFGFPEAGIGIIPGFSATRRLPEAVGTARAKEMIFSCRIIDAEEAARIGLVNKSVAPSELMDECIRLARQISEKSGMAVRAAKEAIDFCRDSDANKCMLREAELFGVCFSCSDQREGMNAFLEKRTPRFKKSEK